MIIKNASVFRNDKRCFEKLDVRIVNGVIADIGAIDHQDDMIDAAGAYLVPGLIDVHTHGRAGYDFVNVPFDKLSAVAKDYARCGVTTVMPTIASAPFEKMLDAVKNINAFVQQPGDANFCGVHIEGRYLNPKRKGAHADSLICKLDPCELEAEVFRMCRSLHITAAYEFDVDCGFASKAKELGATLALGHTDATYSQARIAEQNGVTTYTHLFNAMPPLHHRDGGAVCAALTGECFAELICDGIHVSREMVKLAYSLLGYERTVLISDSMEATGCSDGKYSIAGNDVVVKDGIALTLGGALAGSTLSLDRAVNNLVEFCNIPLTDAILCATENPAKEVGIFDICGSLDKGKRADILFLEKTERLDIKKIMVNGMFI